MPQKGLAIITAMERAERESKTLPFKSNRELLSIIEDTRGRRNSGFKRDLITFLGVLAAGGLTYSGSRIFGYDPEIVGYVLLFSLIGAKILHSHNLGDDVYTRRFYKFAKKEYKSREERGIIWTTLNILHNLLFPNPL